MADAHFPHRTDRLVLRFHEQTDAADLLRVFGREDVARFLLEEPWTAEQTVQRLERRLTRRTLDADPHALALVVEDVEGRFVGALALWLTDVEHRLAEIGWVIDPEQGRRGYATEAISALLRLAFTRLDVRRVTADMDARNHASAALARRLGFRLEGHMLEDFPSKGEITDTLRFGMLARDLPAPAGERDDAALDALVAPVLAHLDQHDPGEVVGVYLYGSAMSAGLRPGSDVDVLMLTRRSLSPVEREKLSTVLLAASAAPPAARDLELTSIVVSDDGQLAHPGMQDYQFGEWRRDELGDGSVPEAMPDPDVPILLATAETAHRRLRGTPLAEAVAPVSPDLVREAMLATIPDILEEIVGDERNTLLALSRMVTTLRTGRIVPKDVAAAAAAAEVDIDERMLLDRAREGYLGIADDDWTGLGDQVTALSHRLAERAHELARAASELPGAVGIAPRS